MAVGLTVATTAFNCEDQGAKVATISLDAVGECAPFNTTYTEETTVEVQVLQKSFRTSLPVYSCQLRISRGEQQLPRRHRAR